MSDAHLPRSINSSTQAIQALAKITSTDQSPSPQPLSTQGLQDGGSRSSSTGSVTSVTRNSPSFPSSEQDIQDSAMFSTIIDHTRGLLPRRESQGQAVGVGDFDHTPPASGRPSVDIPRKKHKGEGIRSQQLFHKPSQIDSPLSTKDQPTSMVSKLLLSTSRTTSVEVNSPLPGLTYHKSSVSQSGTATDSTHTRLRDETRIQQSLNQTPFDVSNVNSDKD
ncbi:hypothetical protein ACHAQC_003821 [Fusarium culmorum]